MNKCFEDGGCQVLGSPLWLSGLSSTSQSAKLYSETLSGFEVTFDTAVFLGPCQPYAWDIMHPICG